MATKMQIKLNTEERRMRTYRVRRYYLFHANPYLLNVTLLLIDIDLYIFGI